MEGLAKMLKRERGNVMCVENYYMAIVQAVLLSAAESWAISKRDMGTLRRLHHRAINHMTGGKY